MDHERYAISAAILHKDLRPLLDAGVKTVFFEDEEHRRTFEWVLEYWDRYGECPTGRALHKEFPTYRLIQVEEPYQYYVDLLREARKSNHLHLTIAEAISLHEARDFDAVANTMSEGVLSLYEEVSSLTDDNLIDGWEARLASYKEIRDSEGLRGITTGFETLDKYTGGWQPEQLITFVGIPKSGKSWIMLRSAMASHMDKHRPLFVTFEMSNAEQAARYDAMLAEINYEDLLYGKMTDRDERKLERALKAQIGKDPFIMVHDVSATTTVPSLMSKIQQYHPDVVFVDGAYLMDSGVADASPTDPRALTAISRAMKRMAQRLHIPVVMSTQASAYKYSAEKGMGLKDILYASGFSQDSDVIIAVDLVPREADTRLLSVMAGRNVKTGVKARVHINWAQAKIEEVEFDPEAWGDDSPYPEEP